MTWIETAMQINSTAKKAKRSKKSSENWKHITSWNYSQRVVSLI